MASQFISLPLSSGNATSIQGIHVAPTTPTNGQVLIYNSMNNDYEPGSLSGTGDVVGPASATDTALVRFNGATGKSIQNSTVLLDGSANITGVNAITISNNGLLLMDTDASNTLLIMPGSNLSANRTFTLTTGDADRTLTMAGNATISGTNTGDVTIGAFGSSPTANGLSISSQVITLQPADATHPGALTTAAQTMAGTKTFSTAPILSSLTASLPLQLDASKNIVSTAIDLSGSQATGILAASRFPALTGDITTSSGALATTLATVNANVGSFGSSTAIPNFTVNGKGLITAAGTNVVIAPAGTLTGTTLASNVVTSSLTTVGTLSSPTIATPTITTSAVIPLVIGGTGTTSTLSLRSTSGVGTTGADIIFQTGNNGATEAMRILNSGSLGIGTASPGAKLVVSANAVALPTISTGTLLQVGNVDGIVSKIELDAFAANGSLLFRRADTTNAAPSALLNDELIGALVYQGYGATAYSTNRATMSVFAAENWSDTAQGSYFTFSTTAKTTTTLAERMRIDASGNVGIGTNAPTNPLSFSGQSLQTIWMERETTAATGGNSLALQAGGAVSGGTDLNGGTLSLGSGVATGTGSSSIQFKTATAQGSTNTTDNFPTAKMTILGSGNVGIGTAVPGAQLHTTGSVRFANFGAGTATFDASGNISSVSDERFKDIQGNFKASLNEIKNIIPILYKWNGKSGLETESVYAGFSAQNVAQAIPEAVGIKSLPDIDLPKPETSSLALDDDQSSDPPVDSRPLVQYYSLQDRALLAAVINAIKVLDQRISALEGKS